MIMWFFDWCRGIDALLELVDRVPVCGECKYVTYHCRCQQLSNREEEV